MSAADPRPDVFEALADPTRRGLLRAVAERAPVTATQLAADLPISRQAVAKHLDLLDHAGLVQRTRVGRETQFAADLDALDEASRWLDDTRRRWQGRLDRLSTLDRSRHGGR